MRHILVTGGAGFIGSNLIKDLLKRHLVTAIDNFDGFYSREIKESNLSQFVGQKNFRCYELDIRDINSLNKDLQFDVIIHLAARAGVRPSITDPAAYYDVNVLGTQALLEFARARGIKQFIFASSSSVYGINQNVPWKETDLGLPISLRFFTVYGPGQRPDLAINKFFNAITNDTRISSIKILQQKIGLKVACRPNIYTDREESFYVHTDNRIYPIIMQLESGRIVKYEFQSPKNGAAFEKLEARFLSQ